MIGYVLRRLALAVSLVWAVSVACFIGFALTFDPLWQLRTCGTPQCHKQIAQLTVRYHLNKPVFERYWYWLSSLVHHGGFSGIDGSPITTQLLSSVRVTTELLAASLLVTAVFAVIVGIACARRPGRPADLVLRTLAYVAWSLPTFLVATVALRWLVPTGWFLVGGQVATINIAVSPGLPGSGFEDWVRGMALPVLALSLGLIGLYSRYVRTAMLTELHRPYAVVALSKGLTDRRVAYRHALRNALAPFVSVLSLEIGAILGASLAVDYVFQMGGLASFFLNALSQSADPYVLTAVVVASCCIVVFFMLVADLAVGWLDPRTATAASR